MKISKEMVDKVLAIYTPGYRYLREAEIEFPIGRGRFQLGKTEYSEAVQHMTDIEAQVCLNQLCYVFFGQGVLNGKCDGLENLTFDEYLELRKENMFVVESHKKFKRETDTKNPFNGQIKLTRFRKQGNLYVAKIDFSLNEGAAIGELSLVLKR